jgi:dTDP-4-dehydrorhamnose reductase
MRILIVGASGLVGTHCYAESLARGHEVLGTFRSTRATGLARLNLEEEASVRQMMDSFQPDAVLCAAAWSWVDGCEGDHARAFVENRDHPARLAQFTHSRGAQFLHFSSSYVFNGSAGPYTEIDTPDPISVYGKAKLAGEQAVQAATGGRALIVRTMGVFGIEPLQKNFVYQVIRNLKAGKRMRVPKDQLGNATDAIDLARGSLSLIESRASGIWNIAGNNPNLNRVAFARLIAGHLRLDDSLIDPISTMDLKQPAKRPLHGGLDIGKAMAALDWQPNDLDRIAWEAYRLELEPA